MIKNDLFNIVLLGAPGCGKGTQAHLLEQRYNLEHISTGELFRKEVAAGTELGKKAQTFIEKGELCPDDYTLDLLYAQMVSKFRSNGFILDGVPRTLQQAQMMQGIGYQFEIPVTVAFYLSIEKEIVFERIKKRSYMFNRPDDSEEVIMNRLIHYENRSKPLEEFYSSQGKLHEINALQDIEAVFMDIVRIIDKNYFRAL